MVVLNFIQLLTVLTGVRTSGTAEYTLSRDCADEPSAIEEKIVKLHLSHV
jgi:hypothetical protein